jgi:nitric oxide reductase NorE protein
MSESRETTDGNPDAAVVEGIAPPRAAVDAAEGNGGADARATLKARKKAETHMPGEEGTWIFIFGDMTVFALLFGVYLSARAADPALFNASQEHLSQSWGAVNTLLLLTSSLFVVTAIRALRLGIPHIAPKLIAGAFACGVGFAIVKYFEWGHHLSDGFKPATNDFWMYYYVLTGLHFFHLLIGMVLLVFIYTQARKVADAPNQLIEPRRFAFVEGAGCFWHMVDLLWIVLFPLLYLVH